MWRLPDYLESLLEGCSESILRELIFVHASWESVDFQEDCVVF